jgi:L-aspartate oxidase
VRGPGRRPFIVGSGIAGLYVALRAQELGLRPTIITKSRLEESNTRYAQGGIAAAVGSDDRVGLHYRDTVRAGDGLVDPSAARVLTSEAPRRIADLVRLGVPFDTVEGQVSLGREAAHSRARILHAGGDATGLQIEETLRRRALDAGIETRERTVLRHLVRGPEGGLVAMLSRADGSDSEEIRGRPMVLATGGIGGLFRESSNPSIATGEGVAIAFRAGALVTDMEFIQFHPTTFYRKGAPRFLITEALRGEGAVLRTVAGVRFMPRYHPDAEMAPRDVVSRAILTEIRRSKHRYVLLDARSLPVEMLYTRFPTICRFLSDHGIDPTRQPIPVAPAAHYMIGGVSTDLWGRTSLPGLWACGEVASTGVHGANRLASNSLLEGLVFGERVARQLRRPSVDGPRRPHRTLEIRSITGGGSPDNHATVEEVRDLLWDSMGIVRTGAGLSTAVARLEHLLGRFGPSERSAPGSLTANAITSALLIGRAALARTESRGAHYRTDFPRPRPSWRKHLGQVAVDA